MRLICKASRIEHKMMTTQYRTIATRANEFHLELQANPQTPYKLKQQVRNVKSTVLTLTNKALKARKPLDPEPVQLSIPQKL